MMTKLMSAAVTVVTRLAFWYTRSTVRALMLLELAVTITSGISCSAASIDTRYAMTPTTETMATAACNKQKSIPYTCIFRFLVVCQQSCHI